MIGGSLMQDNYRGVLCTHSINIGGALHPFQKYWGCSSTSSTPLPTSLVVIVVDKMALANYCFTCIII